MDSFIWYENNGVLDFQSDASSPLSLILIGLLWFVVVVVVGCCRFSVLHTWH